MQFCQKMAYIVDLDEEKKQIAEEAKNAAIQIVQDAIYKQYYGPIRYSSTCAEPVDPYTCYCILNKDFLQKLLEILSIICFKEDTDPEQNDVFAYVEVGNGTNIVYLCEMFWSAPDRLSEDSKPGTLIHEASHLLGTQDITYEHIEMKIAFDNYGLIMCNPDCVTDRWVQINANSVEYEFEITISHKLEYTDGRYPCCGETKINSVCKERPHHYILPKTSGEQDGQVPESGRMGCFWEEMLARQYTGGQQMKYVKKKNKACDVIPVSGPTSSSD